MNNVDKKFALSLDTPWAYMVASGVKWVENRSWRTDYRGRIYIHSGGGRKHAWVPSVCYPERVRALGDRLLSAMGEEGDAALESLKGELTDVEFMDALLYSEGRARLAELYRNKYGDRWWELERKDLEALVRERGLCLTDFAIIGHVDLIDIVQDSASVWAEKGMYHWILDNPVLLERPVVNVKGKLRLFDVSDII